MKNWLWFALGGLVMLGFVTWLDRGVNYWNCGAEDEVVIINSECVHVDDLYCVRTAPESCKEMGRL